MINKLILTGNITKDPESKMVNNKEFIQFDIAVYKRPNESMFVRVKAWEKTAKFMQDLKKGDRVLVDGKLDIEIWDAQDGKKNTKTTIIANGFERIVKRVNSVDDPNFGMASPEEEF